MSRRRTVWIAVGLVGLTAGGALGTHLHDRWERYPPGLGDEARVDSLRCQPMTTNRGFTRATDPRGQPIDGEMVLLDVSHASAAGDARRYGFRDDSAARGYAVDYRDEALVYDVGFIPDVGVPGRHEVVVSRSITVPVDDLPGVGDAWAAICGSVALTVGTDGRLSGAHLVENPDAGTFEYGGRLD